MSVRSTAYDIIDRSTVILVQKKRVMMHEIAEEKKVNISNRMSPVSRMNPDSSSGLYIWFKLQQSARTVTLIKEKFEKEKATKN